MNAAPHPITYPESEDPSVFIDPRGNYHMLTNVNTCHRRCLQGIECGGTFFFTTFLCVCTATDNKEWTLDAAGHAWSRDGLHFTNLTIGAFGKDVVGVLVGRSLSKMVIVWLVLCQGPTLHLPMALGLPMLMLNDL